MAAHASALSPVELSHRELLDVDAQAESLPGWEQEYQQLSAGAYRGEVLHCGLPGANVFIESCNRSVYQRGSAPEGAAALALPLDAEGAGWHAGHVFDVDTMIVLGNRHELDFRTPASLSIAACVVAIDDLMRYAGVFEAEMALGAALLQGAVVLPALVAGQLRDALRSMTRVLSGDPRTALGHGNAAAAFRHGIVAAFTSALAGLDPSRQGVPRSAASRARTVARAVEYMKTHAGQPIGLADVCQAAGVQARVLGYCFHEVFGISPMAYLRSLRLHQVRREIRERPDESLGDIAARWGLWHLSRFAAEYRDLFGELPSATARAARAARAN